MSCWSMRTIAASHHVCYKSVWTIAASTMSAAEEITLSELSELPKPARRSQKNKEKNCSAMGVAGRAKKFFYPYPNPDRSARLQLKSTIPATLLANE